MVVLALAAAAAGCGSTLPHPVTQDDGGQLVTVYPSRAVRAAEATLGYRVVEPTRAVRVASGLPLAEVIVTQVTPQKAIHYVYGDLHSRWVVVLEVPTPSPGYSYDPAAQEVLFAAHGCAIAVTTNLGNQALDRIVRGMGGPRHATAHA